MLLFAAVVVGVGFGVHVIVAVAWGVAIVPSEMKCQSIVRNFSSFLPDLLPSVFPSD